MDCITNQADIAACSALFEVPLIMQMGAKNSGDHSPAGNGDEKQKMAAATTKEVTAGTLPSLALDHGQSSASAAAPAPPHHWYDGALAVTEDVAEGAYKEVTEHPLRVAEMFAIGAGTAALASVVWAPLATAATVAGLGYGAYEIYKHAPGWVHSAEEVANPEGHSQAELAQAHETLEGFGGGATDLAAAIGGGIAYRAVSSAISEALSDAADAHPVKTAAVSSATTNDGGTSSQAAATPTPSDGGTSAQAAATTPTPTDGGTSAHGALVPGHDGSIAHHALAAGQTEETPAAPAITGPDEPLVAGAPKVEVAGATEPKVEVPTTGDVEAAPAIATAPGDVPAAATGAKATTPGDVPTAATPAEATAPGEGAVSGDKVLTTAKPVEVAPIVDLENPANNTSEPALRAAFKEAITASQNDNTPITFKVDTTVPLTDAAGNPVKLTQADVLYQELQAANPENHFVFSKPDLSPGDPGYSEIPAPSVTQDALHISTKENAITLASDTTLPDGTTLPAGSRFAVGTTYDGSGVKSALPDGKVWAVKPDGSYVQVADAGQSTSIPPEALSADPKQFGQVVNAQTHDGFQNHIIVRTDAKAVAPDGSPLLDAYPSGGSSFEAAYKPGSQPGLYAPKPKLADHFLLPSNVTVEANTNWGASTASGADQDYFMKSGFADAQDATAKNYSGPAKDAQSAAELLRIRIAQGLHTPKT